MCWYLKAKISHFKIRGVSSCRDQHLSNSEGHTETGPSFKASSEGVEMLPGT